MIYLCEFNHRIPDAVLLDYMKMQKEKKSLPFSAGNGPWEGKRWEKLRQRLMAWRLLEVAAMGECGIRELRELDIFRTDSGKPYSTGKPKICFNLSHCDMACACILADFEVGVDVERKFSYKQRLTRSVCTEKELSYLESLGEKEQERLLRQLWSVKESFVKLQGSGLGYGMKLVEVELTQLLQEDAVGLVQGIRTKSAGLELPMRLRAQYRLWERPICTVAACAEAGQGHTLPGKVILVSEEELWEANLQAQK